MRGASTCRRATPRPRDRGVRDERLQRWRPALPVGGRVPDLGRGESPVKAPATLLALAITTSPAGAPPVASVGGHTVDTALPPVVSTDARPAAARWGSRQSRVGRPWPGATRVWDRQPRWVRRFAVCVVAHESRWAGLYRAQNPTSTASGVAQWIDSTWRAHVRLAGVPAHARHAAYASRRIQDRVFVWGVRHNPAAWAGDRCA